MAKQRHATAADEVSDGRRELLLSTHRYFAVLAKAMAMGTSDMCALMQLASGDFTAKQLGASLGFTSASITVLIDRLEAANFLERKPHPTDRRGVMLGLTSRGRSVVRRLDGLLARDVEVALREVPTAHWQYLQQFMAVLSRRQHARASEATAPSSTQPLPGRT